MLGNDFTCVIVDEIDKYKRCCLDGAYFSDGITDFPDCKLDKLASHNCYDFAPIGIVYPTVRQPAVTPVLRWAGGVNAKA